MSRLIKINIVKLVFSIIILVIFSICAIINCLNIDNYLPEVYEYQRKNDLNLITFKDIERLKNNYNNFNIMPLSEKNSVVSNQNLSRNVENKVVFTNEIFLEFYNINIIEGSFLDEYMVRQHKKVAVISDSTAISLFMNTSVIGNKILINDQIYEIVGVYEENKNLLNELSSDGYSKIFVPYTSNYNYEESYVEIFSLSINSDKGTTEVENKIRKYVGEKFDSYRKVDFYKLKKVAIEVVEISKFFIGIILCSYIINIIIKIMSKQYNLIKNDMKNYYLNEIIKNRRKILINSLFKIIILIVLIIIIFINVKFKITILPEWLPDTNIFDINYYKSEIFRFIQLCNSNESYIRTINNNYVFVSIVVQIINSIMIVVAFSSLCIKIKEIKICYEEVKNKRIFSDGYIDNNIMK